MGCKSNPNSNKANSSERFLEEYIPSDMLGHAGVFSPNGQKYYLTLSDKSFQNFDVWVSSYQNGNWSTPIPAFFNSEYDEHGVGFSTDGATIYFSSTRPTNQIGIADTWHIWTSHKTAEGWSEPEFVHIPTFEQKLISHPTLTTNNRMYFHSGNTDYSELGLYYSDWSDNEWQTPEKVKFGQEPSDLCITPFVSPDESYLLFGKIENEKEVLYLSYRSNDEWLKPQPLNDSINLNNKSNPFVNYHDSRLYYAVGTFTENGMPSYWLINRIDLNAVLNVK